MRFGEGERRTTDARKDAGSRRKARRVMFVDGIQELAHADAMALRKRPRMGIARTECQAGEVVPPLLGQDAQVHRGDGCNRSLPRRDLPLSAVQKHVDQVKVAVRARASLDGEAASCEAGTVVSEVRQRQSAKEEPLAQRRWPAISQMHMHVAARHRIGMAVAIACAQGA